MKSEKPKRIKREVDAFDVREMLAISGKELLRLRRSPAFPKPHSRTRNGQFQDVWEKKEVERFRERMQECRKKGWLVPQCLYSFIDVFGDDIGPRRPGTTWKKRS
jgi:hypothetical protein